MPFLSACRVIITEELSRLKKRKAIEFQYLLPASLARLGDI